MLAYDHNLARVTSIHGHRVELAFDLDHQRWPWLSLPPQHPVLLEKYQYFAAVTALMAQPGYDPTVYTALTRFSWRCPKLTTQQLATSGVCTFSAKNRQFELELSTPSQILVTSRGEGAGFEDRDFLAWRQAARAKVLAQADDTAFELAPPEKTASFPFVSLLEDRDGIRVSRARVTRQRGFWPVHPFHTGSGDHVNAGHLFDCVLQVAHLVAGCPVECTGGEAAFHRFVELDAAFEIHVRKVDGGAMAVSIHQAGRECAVISLSVVRA